MADQFRRRPLDDWEVEALELTAATQQERLALYVLLDTGLRITEFIRLTPQDVYADRQYVVLHSLKSSKNRQAPLTDRSINVLQDWLKDRPWVGMSRFHWLRVLKRLGLRACIIRSLTPHVLRHTFAVQALRGGIDIRTVQRALGHSSLTVTEQYLVYTEEAGIKAFRDKRWGAL